MGAQRLYEAGKITYMRTDSVNLSDAAVKAASEEITKQFGAEYLKVRHYKTQTKGAQEAPYSWKSLSNSSLFLLNNLWNKPILSPL